tara:strand:- start:609 stop:1007 length:399 start_codon:yes stop_codon:yes gene_type:complete
MSALVRYIIWFVSDAIGLGARVRGPGVGSDIHLVPTSHPKPRDLRSTDEELTGSWYRGPENSHFPPEERSNDMYEKANAESGTAVPNVIPFPISHRKDEVDDVKESQKRHGGTAKIRILFYWSLVGWLLFNL